MSQSSILHRLPSELLHTVLDAVGDVEDLLQLSTSCQVLRNTMNGSFWQRVLHERYKAIKSSKSPSKKALQPRQQVVLYVLRTCYGCSSVIPGKIRMHCILGKRTCHECAASKFQIVPVTRAKREYKLTEEDLTDLKQAKTRNPVHRLYAPMRLYLRSDLERAAERKSKQPKPKRAPRKSKAACSEPVPTLQANTPQVISPADATQPPIPTQHS